MSTINHNYHRQLVSGLDGLPPDIEFDTDLAAIWAASEWLCDIALYGHPEPDIPDDDLLCDFIPGADVSTFLAVDMKAFELIGDDIRKWVA